MATIEQAVSRRQAAFVAKTLRMPTLEEARELREAARADLAKETGERREAELRRAYLGQAGATLESWEREKAGILVGDRADRTKRAEAEARAMSSQRYRGF